MRKPMFTTPDLWIKKRLRIVVLGCGGTGYWVASQLALLQRILKEINPDTAFEKITLYDPKAVAAPNLARTGFHISDVGFNKAQILANKLNMVLGYTLFEGIDHKPQSDRDLLYADLIITCTDNIESRYAVANLNALNTLWLDTGVSEHTASTVLGDLNSRDKVLPNSTELFPRIDSTQDTASASCDMQTSLARQSFGINQTIAQYAVNLIAQLLLDGGIDNQGVILDLKSGFTTPITPAMYAELGYTAVA